jgi:hypothetical protein
MSEHRNAVGTVASGFVPRYAAHMTAKGIEESLRKLRHLPAAVESWQVETGPDATGDEAVWVWVMLRDEDVDPQTRARVRDRVRAAIRARVGAKQPWVYVRFRGSSELSEQ